MAKHSFINRKKEIQLFQKILNHEVDTRILFISGAAGMGKTALLREFVNTCSRENILSSTYDYRGGLDSPFTQLTRHINDLGIAKFDSLMRVLAKVGINSSELLKREVYSSTDIQYALTGFDLENRFSTLSTITDAFIADLQMLLNQKQSIVFFLDSIELMGPITKQWLGNDFLRIAKEVDGAIIIATGRNMIEPSSEVQKLFTRIELGGIDTSEWQQYAKQLSIDLNPEWIHGANYAVGGNPALMKQILMAAAGEKK